VSKEKDFVEKFFKRGRAGIVPLGGGEKTGHEKIVHSSRRGQKNSQKSTLGGTACKGERYDRDLNKRGS